MSRSCGASSLTTSSPMRSSPSVTSSSPATIRSDVVLPQPDGPTKTTSSPSEISRFRSATARVPAGEVLPTSEKVTVAIAAGPLSGLDHAGEPADQLALCEQEEDEHGQERHDDGREDQVPP